MSDRSAGATRPAPMVCVLGRVAARTEDGAAVHVGGSRHRHVVARLVAARGTAVSADALIADLWPDGGPKDPVAALRTFVAEIRRRLEPERPRAVPSQIVVTVGSGYTIAPSAHVDAWEFERVARRVDSMSPNDRVTALPAALGLWRGDAFAEFESCAWSSNESVRWSELRASMVEALADARIRTARADLAVPELMVHVERHPGRERAAVLLATALDRSGRSQEALHSLRRARARLADEYGLDASAELEQAYRDLLGPSGAEVPTEPGWRIDGAVRNAPTTRRGRAVTAASLLRELAVSDADGLTTAQNARLDGAAALSESDDLELAAEFLTRIEIPGIWSVSDDPARSASIVSTARRCLERGGPSIAPVKRARLLALIGIESRGTRGPDGGVAARRALTLARDLRDPAALAPALNAEFLQSFHEIGALGRRHAIGTELLELGATYDMPNHQILGHLICLQTSCGVVDLDAADHHAARADQLGSDHERTLVGFFTTWYRAVRADLSGASTDEVTDLYDVALGLLPTCEMPGVARGLASLVALVRRLRSGEPIDDLHALDFGPNTPWVDPLLHHAGGRRDEAVAALLRAPAPPPDHLATTRWALMARAARVLDDATALEASARVLSRLPSHPIGADTAMFALDARGSSG